jgi:hypothetical protein
MTNDSPLRYSGTIEHRLWSRTQDGPDGCIEFTGARTECGYGRIGVGSRGQGYERTHRVAWELANGPIPAEIEVCHTCDNPPCCNVDHLFLGTHTDNVRDMWSKGRQAGQIPTGEQHPDARLTDAQVADLRALAPQLGNYAELGRRYGISKQHARALVLGTKRAP